MSAELRERLKKALWLAFIDVSTQNDASKVARHLAAAALGIVEPDVERLEALVAVKDQALRSVMWQEPAGGWVFCAGCGESPLADHAQACVLNKALAATPDSLGAELEALRAVEKAAREFRTWSATNTEYEKLKTLDAALRALSLARLDAGRGEP